MKMAVGSCESRGKKDDAVPVISGKSPICRCEGNVRPSKYDVSSRVKNENWFCHQAPENRNDERIRDLGKNKLRIHRKKAAVESAISDRE